MLYFSKIKMSLVLEFSISAPSFRLFGIDFFSPEKMHQKNIILYATFIIVAFHLLADLDLISFHFIKIENIVVTQQSAYCNCKSFDCFFGAFQ